MRVLETSVHDLEEVFTLRLLLEVPATYRACTLLTDDDLDSAPAAFSMPWRRSAADG